MAKPAKTHPLLRIEAESFRSLRKVSVDLQPLTVLVGPNGAGKSNLLSTIRFLGATARLDLHSAIDAFGGFERLCFRGGAERSRPQFKLKIKALVTEHARESATDDYELRVTQYFGKHSNSLTRGESFEFKRVKGRGRRIKVSGERYTFGEDSESRTLAKTSSALSTLPRLGEADGGKQVGQLASLFSSFRVFDVNVEEARRPASVRGPAGYLAENASNLAGFLWYLDRSHPDTFRQLVHDVRYVVPGLEDIVLRHVGGATEAVEVCLEESGLRGVTPLADASFGTVRTIALLAMLHDPDPPQLTCVEEVDHGLHPHAIDKIVDRMREAVSRTQLLVATHSPTFVNRLRPEELVVCERDAETGESRIPAISVREVKAMVAEDDLALGELWFTGALGGGLP